MQFCVAPYSLSGVTVVRGHVYIVPEFDARPALRDTILPLSTMTTDRAGHAPNNYIGARSVTPVK